MIGEAEAGDPAAARITGTLQDISLDKHAEETLRIQARTDPLTGLMNRDAMLNELGTRLIDPVHAQVALLYIDLDRFKTVNDVLGHSAGDELLMQAAARILGAVGTEGLVARFGGDEFLVVCDASGDPAQPERLADAVLGAFAESFRFGKDEFAITASIGIARAPADGVAPAAADPERRHRDVRQQASPAQRLAGLHAGTGAPPAGPPADRDAAAARGGQRANSAWSTSRRSTCAAAASSPPKR